MSSISLGGTPSTGRQPLPPGYVQLFDNIRPGLAAGSYQLTVRQSVAGLDTGTYFGDRTQAFVVDAPRFALDPGDLGEVYPPADSSGDFSGTLPSVVLNRRTLPWDRPLSGDADMPWVALLVFRPGELATDPATGLCLHTGTVADFLAAGAPGLIVPAINRATIAPELLAGTVTSVVVPRAVFTALAPTLADAKLLAHVRHTDTAAQAVSDAAQDGWYSVVVGNRFPDAQAAPDGTGSANLACLISLEGLTAYLPGAPGAPAPQPDQSLRLAVLASWSFTSNPAGGGDFTRLLSALIPSPEQGPGAALPRIPTPPNAPPSAAVARLAEGYAPLTYLLPSGETTFAWYRGPFTPYPAQPLPAPANGAPHYSTAAEVTIYAQDEGLFDLSYAAAFEAGRLAALADRGFAVDLVTARRAAYQTIGLVQGRMNSPELFPVPPATAAAPGAVGPAAGAAGQPRPDEPVAVPAAAARELSVAELASPKLAWQGFGSLLGDWMGDELQAGLASVPTALGHPVIGPPSGVITGPNEGSPPPTGAASSSSSASSSTSTSSSASTSTSTSAGPARPDPVAQMRALLARVDVQDLLAALVRGEVMDPVTDWLARLALLLPVPFRHLVPDQQMLPPESLRFFYLDTGWIAALIDGALSIGVEGSRDLELHQAVSAPLVAAVAEKVGGVRATQRARPDLAVQTGGVIAANTGASAALAFTTRPPGLTPEALNRPPELALPVIPPPATTGAPPAPAPAPTPVPAPAPGTSTEPHPRAGLLLRSTVVAGWPGLSVQADNGDTPLLRLDRLSDTVLLALFDGVPGTVSIGEPWHGLHFGLDDGMVHLRRPDGAEANVLFPAGGRPGQNTVTELYVRPSGNPGAGDVSSPAPTGAANSGVLQVSETASAMLSALRPLLGPDGAGLAMGPALFATELLAGARRLLFRPIPPPPLPSIPPTPAKEG